MKLENIEVDWSKAPEGATHFCPNGVINKWYCQDQYRNWLRWSEGEWKPSSNSQYYIKQYIPRQPTWKSLKDVPVGTFLKNEAGDTYMWNSRTLCICNPNHGQNDSWEIESVENFIGFTYKYGPYSLISYSYTYNGEYLPLVVETEEDKQIKQLQATIDEAQEAIVKAQKQINSLTNKGD